MAIINALQIIRNIFPGITTKCLQLGNNKIATDKTFSELYWSLIKDRRLLISYREAYNIYYHTLGTSQICGNIAEVGVYKGGSAKLISSVSGSRHIYLFDTFEGMPETNPEIDIHSKGDFCDTSLESVRNYLKGNENITYCQGIFPESTNQIPADLLFSFVNLDVDIYESTLCGLRYFYPRLSPGGVMISHDYNSISCPGVKKAFDEFVADNNAVCIPLWDTQCLIVKHITA